MVNDIAVILVGHNHKKYLKKAILSLGLQTHSSDIYYVDNMSSDRSAEYVRSYFSNVQVIENDDNIGYGAANNALMTLLFTEGYRYCLIMNPDVSLDKNAIQYLIATHRRYPSAGLVQPTVLDADGRHVNTIGNASHYLGFGYCPDTGKQYKKLPVDKQIVSVSGACMLIHREFFEHVGGFDESFFLYNEDQDLSWRGLLYGYKHYVSAAAIAYHDYSFSRHRSKWYHSHKNRIMMLVKNYSVTSLILLLVPFIIMELCYLVYCVVTGRVGSFVKAYWYVLIHLGMTVRKRVQIQKSRTVDDGMIIAQFDAQLRSPLFQNPSVMHIVNPFLGVWYMVVSRI